MGNNNVGLYVLDNSGNTFGANPGTVTIATHDISNSHIIGTFEFTATSFIGSTSYSITQGTFDVYY